MKLKFHERLAQIRTDRGFTQQGLADASGIIVSQLRRYEGGISQPSIETLSKLAIALRATTDLLVFGKDQRGPDDELRLLFEAVANFDKETKRIAKALLESLVLKDKSARRTSTHSRLRIKSKKRIVR